ncbi:MAG: MATE family efflux transporter [Pseudomonadota bacterium]
MTASTLAPDTLTRRKVLALALPIMAANVASPLVGLVDIAVIGRTGSTSDIAAVALGVLIFNTLYWALGFLRMSSTALAAQADGAGEQGEARATLFRGALVGAALGLIFVVVQGPLSQAAFAALSGGEATEAGGRDYFDARIWGAPAALAGFAVYGWLIGMGRTGAALGLQIALNLVNAALSILFVVRFDWGVEGVAAASAASQWIALIAAGFIVWRVLRSRSCAPRKRILDTAALSRLFTVNRDIFLRTLALLAGMWWFNEASLREGDAILAGNAILLQFIGIAAYVLDAFAHVTETLAGKAKGAKDWPGLRRAMRLASELALVGAALLSLAFWVFGAAFIALMTTDEATRAVALAFLPFCALAPLIGAPSWQLDGLMIGTTQGPLMRNAMIAALVIYLALDFWLRPWLGGVGLWLAFLGYYAVRAVTLSLGLPGLKRQFETSAPASPAP